MFPTKKQLTMARSLGVALVVAMGLASCATYDDDFARVNSRLDTLDTRVQGAAASAEVLPLILQGDHDRRSGAEHIELTRVSR